ncbi:MAG: TetR/AcrR family transcriptional regulator C-terminal domain-containing protein [Clostridia bacterium]|nr:TetR/AcrR family transcriptional regulator C-terminal domain-containing protein [Clostridia bacterium]
MDQSNGMLPKKEDRRVRRTKKLLTQALTRLLQEKQISEITVRELTDLADMNRGTFYLYYRDIFDMLEKIEDSMFEALDDIVSLHQNDDVSRQAKPILLDLFRFIEENQEICSVLLSPHGDMNFLHRLNQVVREKCLQLWPNKEEEKDSSFEYHYSFVVYGCVGVFRAWLNGKCQEPAEKMAEMADAMIRRGSL